MKVVDAGVVIELVAGRLASGLLGKEELAAPHLLDTEVIHGLRGMVLRGSLSDQGGVMAVRAFSRLTVTRHPTAGLHLRMWELRHNLTGYDATYVALAELLEATALLTTDARLARSPGVRCHIQLL